MERNQPHDQAYCRDFSPIKASTKINNMRRRDKNENKKTSNVLAHRLSALKPVLHSSKPADMPSQEPIHRPISPSPAIKINRDGQKSRAPKAPSGIRSSLNSH